MTGIVEFAVRQFENLNVTPLQAVLYIVLIYASLGVLAAITGYRIGKKPDKINSGEKLHSPALIPDTGWDTLAPGQRFHLYLLYVHLIALPVFLFIFNSLGLHPLTLVLCFAYILFCLLWYKRIKYRLMKPFFWIHLLLIAALAGVFWKSPESAAASSRWEGWIMGGGLVLRAILVITSFSALSAELRNPRLKTFLFKFGSGKIYNAVSMAFSALPLMMDRGVSGKSFLANPFRALRKTIHDADDWLHVLQQQNHNQTSK